MPETIPHTDEAVSASPAVEQSSGTTDPVSPLPEMSDGGQG